MLSLRSCTPLPHNPLYRHVEDTDVSILEAVARETWEETGLVVEKVLAEIEPLEYSVEKIVAEGEGVQATIVKNTTHLNFIAKISAMDFPPVVTLSHEHESYKWITKRDLVELKESEITGGMKGIVEKALDWTENNASVLHAEYSVTHGEGKTQV
jgi:8-oxo-dGTP pyrophosphatase MutT (NUDIX family)